MLINGPRDSITIKPTNFNKVQTVKETCLSTISNQLKS